MREDLLAHVSKTKVSAKSKLFTMFHIYLYGPFICGGYLQVCQLVIGTYKKIIMLRTARERTLHLSNDSC